MSDIDYNPQEYVKMLRQILISDFKKIGFLCGAGTSALNNENESIVPTMSDFSNITGSLTDTQKRIVSEIKAEIKKVNKSVSIEDVLSNITLKIEIIGHEKLLNMDKSDFQELKRCIEEEIKKNVSVHKKVFEINKMPHIKFIHWIKNSLRKCPVEIYTTNYDYIFEMALEEMDIPFFDGFVGGYKPFFYTDAVELDEVGVSNWTKLWKIHGSLGWNSINDGEKIIKDYAKNEIMILPSILKYANSKKQPYVSMIDRLKSFIMQDDSVLFIIGYSFGDQHINEIILSALRKSRSSHVYAFMRSDIKKYGELVSMAQKEPRLSIYAKDAAVIGGRLGNWALKQETNKEEVIDVTLYFEQDANPSPAWDGKGEFLLGDFNKFSNFLISFVYENYTLNVGDVSE